MNFNWNYFIHGGMIAAALLLATVLRAKIRFFQKFLIPNSIIAGFMLLPVYNFLLPTPDLGRVSLGEFAYHLLAISFIAMTLRPMPKSSKEHRKTVLATSVGILSQFGLQAFIGLLFTAIFIATLYPDLFHSFGFLFPLGFAQGPGQAYAIGEGWKIFGIQDAGNIGLTFAAIGFLFCAFGGIFLINFGVRKNWISRKYLNTIKTNNVRTGIFPKGSQLPVGSYQITQPEAIDSLTLNVVFVLFTYFLTFLLLKLLGILLPLAGKSGKELAANFWGISFIFAALMGLVMRRLFTLLKIDYLLEVRTLNRLSGVSVDIMVTSAIAAINLVVVARYWLPILSISLIGGLITLITIPWIGSRMFTDHKFLRVLLVFGVSTGTLATGLALLRVLDPEFETPVATDYSYAAGITFMLAIPFILSINLPAKAWAEGNMSLLILAFIVSGAYMLFSFIAYLFLAGKKSFARRSKVWLKDEE
ncbi:MAG: sodium:glutamate symporter [Spirochaetales bacterium]|nr:sodium:glutamate symporter [Spirochaetales bacterium]